MPKYNFGTEDDFAAELRRQNIQIPLDHDTSILGEKVRLPGGRVLSNRLVIQPVECHDSEPDGSPSEYTFGRYRRYAAGGAGVVWIEACAVSADARGHGRMLYINDDNIVKFRKLAAGIRAAAKRSGSTEPYIILQLHYSGRFGRRHDIVFHNDYLDSQSGVEPDQHVLTDEELSTVGQQFIDAAVLSEDAGFDAVDVKCCHGYLLSELLSGFSREGCYGGSFENRTRLHMEIIRGIKAETGLDIAVRMDTFNPIPGGHGWGTVPDAAVDISEPSRLASCFSREGVKIIGLSAGIPYIAPGLSRPFNSHPDQPEHPLVCVARLLSLAGMLQRSAPETLITAAGLSALKQFAPAAASALIRRGGASLAGFAREAVAYPGFPKDIINTGGFVSGKECVLCDGCIRCIEAEKRVVCVVRAE